jgi:hypothetical protein
MDLPVKKINTLPEQEWYSIYKAKTVYTKYGRAILVWLYDRRYRPAERFKVFLPPAVCKTIPDDSNEDEDVDKGEMRDITSIPSSVKQLPWYKMAYCGQIRLNNGYARYDVRFSRQDERFELLC